MSDTLLSIELDIKNLVNGRNIVTKEYNSRMKNFDNKIEQLQIKRNLLLNDLDIEKVQIAEQYLVTQGKNTSKKRQECIDDLIVFISTGKFSTYKNPLKAYYGVKNYSGFGDQREDHEFGYGPRHGSIVFRVALSRLGIEKVQNEGFTSEEKEAMIYYLRSYNKIFESRNKEVQNA